MALSKHKAPVTKILSLAIGMLKRANPGLRLIVSFADVYHGHLGVIYQAGNWTYTGTTHSSFAYIDLLDGRTRHPRNIRKVAGRDVHGVVMHSIDEVQKEERPGKYRYLWPLDKAMRRQIEPLARPYPKRADEVLDGCTSPFQGEGAGSIPSRRL